MKYGKRELSQEAERTRAFNTDISLSTGGGTSVPLFRAWADCKIQRVALLPRAAFTRHASNYWTFDLAIYNDKGAKDRTVRNSTLALDDYGLSVGKPVLAPTYGRLDALVKYGESVWVVVAETGTASDVKVRAQVDVTRE